MTDAEEDLTIAEDKPEIIRKRARVILLGSVFRGAVVVLLAISLSILVANAVVSFATRERLLSCTQPDGDCYKDSRQESGQLIQGLIDVEVQINAALAVCYDRQPNQTTKWFIDCIERELDNLEQPKEETS